ncbi:hypothetical protein FGU65_14190 [Methanoculleus sp. FWC-SCC1]|uniref:Uncharacterized protein n=1 Tax=Methanoculleus frigidifontis TaxID=2584085 RepID=A0ABT8MDJ5_9EURY|nr:hypothetical protein [Methanoculleus sp. FWC-SCC1]MDN7026019.1 hypothetical protein [Methanoculleus sp. FWC-SCC1]
MTPQHGMYAPDGKYIQGELKQYGDLAALLAEGSVALYAESDRDKMIFGSAVNVQKAGQRQDMLIVIVEYPLRSFGSSAVREFFRTVRTVTADAKYTILSIGNDASFFRSIDSDDWECSASSLSAGRSTIPSRQPNDDGILQYLVGRIVAQKPAYATTKRMACSASLVSRILESMQPILYLGYRFAVGRDIVDRKNPFDLWVLPIKPFGQKVADLDSGIIDVPEKSFYQRSGEMAVLVNKELQSTRNRPSISSKEEYHREISVAVRRKMNSTQRVEYHRALERENIPLKIKISIDDAVRTTVESADRSYLERYLSSAFDIGDFERCVYKLPAEEFLRFFKTAKPVLVKLDESTKRSILQRLSSYAKELQDVERDIRGRYEVTPRNGVYAAPITDNPHAVPIQPNSGKDPSPNPHSNDFDSTLKIKKLLPIIAIAGLVIVGIVAAISFGLPTSILGAASEGSQQVSHISDDGGAELLINGSSLPDGVADTVRLRIYSEGEFGDPAWTTYNDKYYAIEPENLAFPPEAKLVFILNESQPEQLFVGHTTDLSYSWLRVDSEIEGQNVTIHIRESGMYALFLENMDGNSTAAVNQTFLSAGSTQGLI